MESSSKFVKEDHFEVQHKQTSEPTHLKLCKMHYKCPQWGSKDKIRNWIQFGQWNYMYMYIEVLYVI